MVRFVMPKQVHALPEQRNNNYHYAHGPFRCTLRATQLFGTPVFWYDGIGVLLFYRLRLSACPSHRGNTKIRHYFIYRGELFFGFHQVHSVSIALIEKQCVRAPTRRSHI